MQESRHATNLDKGTIGLEGLDESVDNVASAQVGHLLFDNGPSVGDDELVALLVDLEELEGKSLSNQVFCGKLSRQVRSRQESPKSLHEANGTSPVHVHHLRLKDLIVGLVRHHLVPGLTVLNSSDTHEQLSVLVFFRDDLKVEFGVEFDQVFNVVAGHLDECGFGNWQKGRGLGANVHGASAVVVLHDRSLDDIVSVKGVIRGLHGLIKVVVRKPQAHIS
mmetsp:Transcript_21658/g.39168  ORF Transcript_21658/g.39168 Transcript_21658/m.39168 type:complete len:221 (+) Transcript_21658:497-1159(+)